MASNFSSGRGSAASSDQLVGSREPVLGAEHVLFFHLEVLDEHVSTTRHCGVPCSICSIASAPCRRRRRPSSIDSSRSCASSSWISEVRRRESRESEVRALDLGIRETATGSFARHDVPEKRERQPGSPATAAGMGTKRGSTPG